METTEPRDFRETMASRVSRETWVSRVFPVSRVLRDQVYLVPRDFQEIMAGLEHSEHQEILEPLDQLV